MPNTKPKKPTADEPKNLGGRPLKFKTAKELEGKITSYFNSCNPHMEEVTEWVDARDAKGGLKKDENGLNYLVEVSHRIMTKQQPYTITGLALALDTSRETLLDYEDRDGFSDTIKKAKIKCQNYAEQVLFSTTPTGAIFNLKNNYGWRDRNETDLTTNGNDIGVAINADQAEQLIRARAERNNL